jgi:hypothetical protein
MQQTRVSRRWLVKIMLFLLAAAGLGVWGLADATVFYPRRGHDHAEYQELEYLKAMENAGRLQPTFVTIVDPRAEWRAQRGRAEELERSLAAAQAGGRADEARRLEADKAKLEFLQALANVGALSPERTRVDDPRGRRRDLDVKWQSRPQPKPLSAFDIPMQWLFVAVGFGLAGWIGALIFMVSARKHRYEPEELRLHLPGGRTVVPADIKELDKRKWDKFIVFLVLKDGSAPIRLDLLRYEPLEAWILEMEKRTDGYTPPPEIPGPTEAEIDRADEAAARAVDGVDDDPV